GRAGAVDEVAPTVVFLASARSSYTRGAPTTRERTGVSRTRGLRPNHRGSPPFLLTGALRQVCRPLSSGPRPRLEWPCPRQAGGETTTMLVKQWLTGRPPCSFRQRSHP